MGGPEHRINVGALYHLSQQEDMQAGIFGSEFCLSLTTFGHTCRFPCLSWGFLSLLPFVALLQHISFPASEPYIYVL